VPPTVIYSRTDAIVSWRAAIDRYNPQAKHVQVPGSHVSLGNVISSELGWVAPRGTTPL